MLQNMPSPRSNRVPPSGSAGHAIRERRESHHRRRARALARYLARRTFHQERMRYAVPLTTIVRLTLRVCAWQALPIYRDMVGIVRNAFDEVGLSNSAPPADGSARTGNAPPARASSPSPHIIYVDDPDSPDDDRPGDRATTICS